MQLSVFGTSVFAARHMAACHWPGFASGGVLWFPDLTKAAAVIHWAQVLLKMHPLWAYLQAFQHHLGAASAAGTCMQTAARITPWCSLEMLTIGPISTR